MVSPDESNCLYVTVSVRGERLMAVRKWDQLMEIPSFTLSTYRSEKRSESSSETVLIGTLTHSQTPSLLVGRPPS
jgi:hypothetical protein